VRKVLVVLVALALAGCGSADGDGGLTLEDPPSTSSVQPVEITPEEELDPEATIKAEIVAAYHQSFDAFVAVASDPTGQPDDPRLAEHTKGTALAASELSIRKWRAEGHVLEVTQLVRNPQVIELGPDTAVVEDCGIDVSALVDETTGEVIEPSGPAEAKLTTATYVLFDSVWMQNSFKPSGRPCVPPGS
jgi:hypothetical protein